MQGLYALVVYVFLSLHTLTKKHKKYGLEDEVEPLKLYEGSDYFGSITTLAESIELRVIIYN